jgi:hypothetical protein
MKRPEPRRTVIGVEADRLELETWGRAAALRRQDLPEWIKRSLSEAVEQGEQRRCPLPRSRKMFLEWR